jgi:hypothetical protein
MEAFEIEGFCIEIGVNNLNTEHGKKKKKGRMSSSVSKRPLI